MLQLTSFVLQVRPVLESISISQAASVFHAQFCPLRVIQSAQNVRELLASRRALVVWASRPRVTQSPSRNRANVEDQVCECAQAGWCERYQRRMFGRLYAICRGEALTPEKCAAYREIWAAQAHDASFAAQFARDWSNTERIRSEQFACVHRGGQLRQIACGQCGGRGLVVDVFACEVHRECTVGSAGMATAEQRRLKSCLRCEDRVDP